MGKTYVMGVVVSKIFVCIEDCNYQYGVHCENFYFKKGQSYEYKYQKRKFSAPIYNCCDGKYNGSVKYAFIDRYFLPEEEYNTLLKLDKWYDVLLHSSIKIKRFKKTENI